MTDPDGDYDRLRRRVLWSMPTGLYILGSRFGARRNAMTLSWATQVSIQPKQIGVGVLTNSVTHELVSGGDAFALSLLAREDRALVRKFVKPMPQSASDADEEAWQGVMNGVDFSSSPSGLPVVAAAVGFLQCSLRQSVPVGDHTFFIGEVTATGFFRDEQTEILRMEDTRMNYGG